MTPPSGREFDRRGFDRGAWLTLIAMLGFACIVILTTAYLLTLPGDGWQVPYDAANAMTPSWLMDHFIGDWATPLQPNDIVIAINGSALAQQASLARWNPPANWQDGGSVQYTILRNGQRLTMDVILHRLGMAGILRGFGHALGDSPLDWVWLLVGITVFLLRPRDPAARLLLVIGVTLSMVTKLGWASTTISANFAPTFVYYLKILIDGFWVPIFWPSIILFVLSFPLRVFPLRNWPRAVPVLLYGLPLGITLLTLATGNMDLATLALIGEAVLLFLAFGAALFNAIKRSRDAVVRAQVLWVVFGFVLSIGLVLPFYLLEYLGWIQSSNVELINVLIGPIASLFLPVSLGIAITKYQLFNIQVIIRKTLVYSLLTGLLALVYFGSVTVMQSLLSTVSGQQSTIILVLSTLLIAALFNPLRKRIQDFIDRRFYRQKYDADHALDEFAAAARSETDLEVLTSKLVSLVRETMQPEKVAVWLQPSADKAVREEE